jgi:hypothetical protein
MLLTQVNVERKEFGIQLIFGLLLLPLGGVRLRSELRRDRLDSGDALDTGG